MRKDYLENIIRLLNPHVNSNLPLGKTVLNQLFLNELIEFHKFLEESKPLKHNILKRPKCPVKNMNYSSKARFPYKKAMNNYIKEWGYSFNAPVQMSAPLFEAIANYLENLKKK